MRGGQHDGLGDVPGFPVAVVARQGGGDAAVTLEAVERFGSIRVWVHRQLYHHGRLFPIFADHR